MPRAAELQRISSKVLHLTLFCSQRTNRSRTNRRRASPNDQLLYRLVSSFSKPFSA
jgi:hypothetical protein